MLFFEGENRFREIKYLIPMCRCYTSSDGIQFRICCVCSFFKQPRLSVEYIIAQTVHLVCTATIHVFLYPFSSGIDHIEPPALKSILPCTRWQEKDVHPIWNRNISPEESELCFPKAHGNQGGYHRNYWHTLTGHELFCELVSTKYQWLLPAG